MKVRDKRSSFVVQAQSLKDSVAHLYPGLPWVPLRAWSLSLERHVLRSRLSKREHSKLNARLKKHMFLSHCHVFMSIKKKQGAEAHPTLSRMSRHNPTQRSYFSWLVRFCNKHYVSFLHILSLLSPLLPLCKTGDILLGKALPKEVGKRLRLSP